MWPCDYENGDDLELPPHGRPSPKSREVAPKMIARMLAEIQDRGVKVSSLVVGQGLVEMVGIVEQALLDFGLAPLPKGVKPSKATHASERERHGGSMPDLNGTY